MALFDFFRRRRKTEPEPQPAGRGIFNRIRNLFRREQKEPEPPAVPPISEPEPEPPAAPPALSNITDSIADQSKLNEGSNRQIINTLVEHGYIQPFKNDHEAAEFLRVLESDAWNENHRQLYGPDVMNRIQNAIARGATAGALQEQYNKEIEKKSNTFLVGWEDFLSWKEPGDNMFSEYWDEESGEESMQPSEAQTAPQQKKQTRKQKKRNKRRK